MRKKKSNSRLPKGWDEARVRSVIDHYENQSDDEAAAEDQAAYRDRKETFVSVPVDLLPAVRKLIAKKAS